MVALSAPPEEVLRRTGRASGRPLLDGAAIRWRRPGICLQQREPFYARAHVRVDTVDKRPEQVVTEVARCAYEGEGAVMKRVDGGAWFLAAGRRCVGLAACTDANESLIVVQAQVPDDECVVSDEADETRPAGVGHPGRGPRPALLLQAVPAGRRTTCCPWAAKATIEPNRVQVTGARVKIVPPPGVTVPFRRRLRGRVRPPQPVDRSAPGSQRAVRVEAVRACHAALFQDLFKPGRLNPAVGESVYFRVIVRVKGHHGGTRDPLRPVRVPGAGLLRLPADRLFRTVLAVQLPR